ncbi:MAG: hypothetical protein H7Y41_05705, partial [Hyphomonadaceae bacterium]|nr:hypothetical protein [Clostridia bacterium]
ADFHAHSVESDGGDAPSAMIEEHYKKGFDILSMTDHNFLSTTWDRTDRTNTTYLTSARLAQITAGTDRNNRGMTAILNADEQSLSDHVNTFFAPFNNVAGATLESSIAKAEELGGISHMNHPGRYTGGAGKIDAAGEAASNNPTTVSKYVNLFNKYLSCVGMEIINKKDGDSASDRILWDNILKQTMPGRPVWGFSNDDTHALANTGYSYNMMLMPENNVANVRKAMENGTFYATALVSYRELGTSFVASGAAPKITNIVVDQKENSITLQGENYTTIEWVADGKIIATGNTIDLNQYEDGINNYVRAQLKGAGGISFTQPFGVMIDQPIVSITGEGYGTNNKAYYANMAFESKNNFYAGEFEISYDTAKMSLTANDVKVVDGLSVINFQTQEGVAKFTVVALGKEKPIAGKIASLTFNLNDGAKNNLYVAVTKALLGDGNIASIQTKAQASNLKAKISNTNINISNGTDIQDLSIIGLHYGLNTTSTEWDKIKVADMNFDGKLDIVDLTIVASNYTVK